MSGQAIVVDGVSRTFGRGATRVIALAEASFSVAPGEVVALLGSNGAGKTTLIKVLSTLLLPTTGRAELCGHDVVGDVHAARAVTSVVFGGDRGLYARLSGRDNIRFFGMLAGVSRRELRGRVPTALEQVNLTAAADRPVETYSKGMRQRLHLAIGLLSRPAILLLDEPTIGLDPLEAERLRGAVTELRDHGVAILLTSHYLLDVERLADRVLLLGDGRIRRDLTLAEFVRQAGHAAEVVVRGGGEPPALDGAHPAWVVGCSVTKENDGWTVTLRLRAWSAEVFRELGALFANVGVHDVQVREERLEDAFRRLAGQSAR